MEGDGSSESTSPRAPLPQPDEYLEPVIFEPVPAAETALEPDPDVVLENLFRNSVGNRRKSAESRRKPARHLKNGTLQPTRPKRVRAPRNLSDDYVCYEISSDSDGSTPNCFPTVTPVSAPTLKKPVDFEFVDTVDLCPAAQDQPLEEDPLGGEEPVPGEGTVLDPLSNSPLVPVPQDLPLARVIPVDVPFSNGVNHTDNELSLDAVPGRKTLDDPIKIIKKLKLSNSVEAHPQTTNITISTALETTSISNFSNGNVQNSFECDDDDFIEVEIDKGPPNGADALQSAYPTQISQPGGTLRPIPFDILSGRPLNDKLGVKSIKSARQTATRTSKFVPIPSRQPKQPLLGGTLTPISYRDLSGEFPNDQVVAQDTGNRIQPGSNVVVVMRPDGQLQTVPLQSFDDQSSSSSSADLGVQPEEPPENRLAKSATARPRGRPRKSQLNGSPVTSTTTTAKPKGRTRKSQSFGTSTTTTAKPKRRPRKTLSNVPPSNSKSPGPPSAIPLSGSWTNPDSPIISNPVKLEKDPLEGPELDASSLWPDVSHLKQEENPLTSFIIRAIRSKNDIPPTDSEPNIDSFLDKPSTARSKPLKRPGQSLWPPPNISWRRKRKLEPKIPLPVAQIPLSGSWTNPNPLPSIEKDPLDGPVRKIISESSSANCTKGTQYYIGGDVALREFAGLETADPSRPLLSVRGYGIDVPTKQMVYNLYKYFEQRRITHNLIYISTDLIQVATGMKTGTVMRILREAKKTSNDFETMPQFAPIDRRRNRVRYKVSNLRIDMALRECMLEHFLKKKEAISLMVLKKKCNGVISPRKTRNNWNFMRLRIKTLGFVSVRTVRRKVHVEGAVVRAWRHKYLTELARAVEGQKNIVFTLVVDMFEGPVKATEDEWVIMESENEIKQERRVLTVFHAANKAGYLDEGFFIKDVTRNRLNSTQDNYYSEWLELNVLQKIPKDSVVVLAHEQFHSMEDMELKPNEGFSKKQIIDWLRSRLVGDIDESLPKCVLLDKAYRIPVERGYSIDSLVKTYGHTPLHLFPYQRDLNPLEYVWEDIRSKYQKQRTLKFTKDQLRSAFDSNAPVFGSGWKRCETRCEYYFNKDPLIEEAQEVAIKKLGGVWSPLLAENPDDVVDEENLANEHEGDSASVKSPAKSNKSESDSDSDSDSSLSDSDSDSDSDDTTSSESESDDDDDDDDNDVPPSEQVDRNNTIDEEKTETASL